MYGLKDKYIKNIQVVFAGHSNIDKVILYGSRSKGNYRPNSDIDLVLVGENLDLSEKFAIEIELDDLLLPYKIDVAIFHHINNGDLIGHIKRHGTIFYDKNNMN
jgi:predicted nucleotidyltransferase